MNYYNEYDPKAAAWLRELIRAGQIPPGDVDERSITEIKPYELSGYTQCHFFAGIGGWSLALQLAGWPATRPVWTGSCPCQPFSSAGKQLAQADERHLWPVFFALIRECRPEFVFGEQVASAIGKGWLDGVSSDLEGAGYACGAAVLGAHSVGAPHIRQRLYWVADRDGERLAGWEESDLRALESEQQASRRADAVRCGHDGWQRVVFDHECDEDGNCPVCGTDFADCGCPGPTSEGWEHDVRNGVLVARRVDDAVGARLEGHAGHEHDGHQPGRLDAHPFGSAPAAGGAGAWSRFDLIPCADGKTRRVESGTFPLADGVPARVVRLRGYGNAIVPQVAAEFVTAYLEATQPANIGDDPRAQRK